MLSTLASLVLLAGPLGLEAKDPVALVTQLEERLPKWLAHGGDRQAMLATREQLEAYIATLPGTPGERAQLLQIALEEQQRKPTTTTFDGRTRAVVELSEVGGAVSFFNDTARCSIGLLRSGKRNEGRFVVADGPTIDDLSFARAVELANATVVFLEKKGGVWAAIPRPKPGPPACETVLKKSAREVYTLQRAFFAEFDRYEAEPEKVGVTLAPGVKLKISASGQRAPATFSAELSLNDGVVQITDQSPDPKVVKSCTK